MEPKIPHSILGSHQWKRSLCAIPLKKVNCNGGSGLESEPAIISLISGFPSSYLHITEYASTCQLECNDDNCAFRFISSWGILQGIIQTCISSSLKNLRSRVPTLYYLRQNTIHIYLDIGIRLDGALGIQEPCPFKTSFKGKSEAKSSLRSSVLHIPWGTDLSYVTFIISWVTEIITDAIGWSIHLPRSLAGPKIYYSLFRDIYDTAITFTSISPSGNPRGNDSYLTLYRRISLGPGWQEV